MTECPICGAELTLESGTVKGELIECSDCGIELEVISVKPFRVDEAPLEEEDWGAIICFKFSIQPYERESKLQAFISIVI